MRGIHAQDLRCTHPPTPRASQIPPEGVHHKSILDFISNLVSIAASSPRIQTLEVQQGRNLQQHRAQLNIILRSEPGSFKSTILREVGQRYKVLPYSNVTYPAMIGTIDQNSKELIPGLVWQCRKKPLLLDEFKTGERGDTRAVDVLLGVMEQGYYKRKIGLLLSHPCNETDSGLFYRAENGEIEVKTQLSAIIATMKNWDMARSGKYAALAQRCIPVRYKLDDTEVDAVLDGAPVFRRYAFSPKVHVRIGRKDFARIRQVAADVREDPPEGKDFRPVYTRAIGDLCRIFAVTSRFDERLFRVVCYLKAGLGLEQALNETES